MIDAYDVMTLVGLALLGVGLGLVSVALALAVVGGLLIVAGILGGRVKGFSRAMRRRPPRERE